MLANVGIVMICRGIEIQDVIEVEFLHRSPGELVRKLFDLERIIGAGTSLQ